jgi:fatty-acyl-CoA synthase
MTPRATPLPLPAPSLDEWLQRLARERPQAIALSTREPGEPAGPDTDYAELARWAEAVARHLQTQHAVQPGDRIAWLGLNHPLQIVLLFALARLGALLVPLNHRLAAAEWAAVLADCQPRLLVHDTHFAPAVEALPGPAPAGLCCIPSRQLPQCPGSGVTPGRQHLGHDDARDQPVLLVYTSGTTGAPKAAVHTQGNLLANMAIAARVQGLTASDTVLTVLPLFHVGGLCIQTLPALSVGARVLLFSRFDATATLACIAHERPTFTLQVPATLKALTEHPQWSSTDLSSLCAVWAGSSLLPPAALAAFHARGVPVCNVYGSTETGPFSIALPAEHAQDHAGSCGWPAPGVEVELRDALGTVVAPGAVGEICIRAPNVVRHYWPDRAACDADGFFHSGDLAQQAPDGSFTVVGRSKDMIISGGENIYPAEIENLLLQHPLVVECSVIGQADSRWGEVAVAVLVLQPTEHERPDWAEPFQRFLEGRLARYKWPRRWLRVDALPKTALGKVQKAALKRLLDAPAAE